MSEFKIFSGKNVDEAIVQAQEYYGQDRDKLEIEIVSGGSTGIFGLVGKKKAEIRARVRGAGRVAAEPSRTEPSEPASSEAPAAEPQREPGQGRDRRQPRPPRQERGERQEKGERPERQERGERPERGERQERGGRPPRQERGQAKPAQPAQAAASARPEGEGRPKSLAEEAGMESFENGLDEERRQSMAEAEVEAGPLTEELAGIVKGVLETLLGYITETAPRIEISGNSARVSALVFDEENSGLIIGREGQTLAALQYLVNRIVARKWADPVRVQINTGEYREKQDENLRKMALYLADKAKTQGRPQSTKPLSSYHRRVVHMALQDDKTVQTRSKGDGPFKKVIILPKRRNGDGQSGKNGENQAGAQTSDEIA